MNPFNDLLTQEAYLRTFLRFELHFANGFKYLKGSPVAFSLMPFEKYTRGVS